MVMSSFVLALSNDDAFADSSSTVTIFGHTLSFVRFLLLPIGSSTDFLHAGKSASRMLTISIFDLKRREALQAVKRMRRSHAYPPGEPIEDNDTFNRVISRIGGRLSFLGKLAKARDLESYAEEMVQREKGWLGSLIGLIPDHDDDVMDEVCFVSKRLYFSDNI